MMTKNNDLTTKNLEQLNKFLQRVQEDPALAAQMPDSAHIFHGAADDADLTQSNLKLAARMLLGVTLGYVEDAPLVMVYKHKSNKYTVIDLSAILQKEKAQTFVESFQEQNRQEMTSRLSALAA